MRVVARVSNVVITVNGVQNGWGLTNNSIITIFDTTVNIPVESATVRPGSASAGPRVVEALKSIGYRPVSSLREAVDKYGPQTIAVERIPDTSRDNT